MSDQDNRTVLSTALSSSFQNTSFTSSSLQTTPEESTSDAKRAFIGNKDAVRRRLPPQAKKLLNGHWSDWGVISKQQAEQWRGASSDFFLCLSRDRKDQWYVVRRPFSGNSGAGNEKLFLLKDTKATRQNRFNASDQSSTNVTSVTSSSAIMHSDMEPSDTPYSSETSTQTASYTLNLVYKDPNGEPLPCLNYIIESTDQGNSTKISGKLDKDAKAQELLDEPGNYSVTFKHDENELTRLKQTFIKAIQDTIQENQARKDELDVKFQSMGIWEEGFVLSKAFVNGFLDQAVELTDAAVDVMASIATGAEALASGLYEKLADGYSLEELKDDYAFVCNELDETLDQAEKIFEVLEVLGSDPEVWQALIAFPVDWFGSLPAEEKAEFFGAAAFEVVLLVASTLAAGPAGTLVAAGASLASKGKMIARIVSALRPILKTLLFIYKAPQPQQIKISKKVQYLTGSHSKNSATLPNQSKLTDTSQAQNDNGQCSPINQKCDLEGDPISITTGEELTEATDFVLPGIIPVVWNRVYRSSATRVCSELGYGWSHPWSLTLEQDDHKVRLRTEQGLTVTFDLSDYLSETSSDKENIRLSHPSGVTLHRTNGVISIQKDGLMYEFEPRTSMPADNGKEHPTAQSVSRIRTRDNLHYWTLNYDSNRTLISAEASWGAQLDFLLDPHGHWREIRHTPQPAHTGDKVERAKAKEAQTESNDNTRQPKTLVRYRVNVQGDLIGIKVPQTPALSYAYRAHLFTKHKSQTGLAFFFEWDSDSPRARCTRQYAADGHYDYRFEWDVTPNEHHVTDGRGYKKRYFYNELGQKTKLIDPEGHTESWHYTAQNDIAYYQDKNGREHRYEYDDQQRLTQYTLPTGESRQIRYWKDTLLPELLIDEHGKLTRCTYDRYEQLIARTVTFEQSGTDSPDIEERWHYDGLTLHTYIDPQGRKHHYKWNEDWHEIANYSVYENVQKDASLIAQQQFNYDDQGRVHSVTDLSGHIEHYQYDNQDRLILKTDDQGFAEQYKYDPTGRLTQHQDRVGRTTHYEYGVFAQLLEKRFPDGSTERFDYDEERNLIAIHNGNDQAHRFEYDGNERLIKETYVDGREIHYQYDGLGQRIGQREGEIEATFEYNAYGQLTKEQHIHATDVRKNVVQDYQYDAFGNLTQANNDNANLGFEYDTLGRLVQERTEQAFPLPLGGVQDFQHHIDIDGYTAHNRPKTVHYRAFHAVANTTRYLFLRHGSQSPWSFSQDFKWNDQGQLTHIELDHHDATKSLSLLNRSHNARGQVTYHTQGRHQTQYQYNDHHQLTSVQRQKALIASSQGNSIQQPFGHNTERTTEVLSRKEYEYDAFQRLKRITDKPIQTSPHKANGREKYIDFGYTAKDHLSQTQTEQGVQPYQTDAAGNRLPDGLTQLNTNRLPFWGDRHFQYDQYGNLITIRKGKDQCIEQQLTYNAKHQLIGFEERKHGQLTQALTYRYDALGRRTEKRVYRTERLEGQTDYHKQQKHYIADDGSELWYHYSERYVWHGDKLIQVRQADKNFHNQTWQHYYLYEPDSHAPVALFDNATGVQDIETDHLGTPTAVYQHDTGEQLWSTEYEIYGKRRRQTNPLTTDNNDTDFDPKLRFQGQYEDIETGLYQNLHRYYDPHSGRYITHDPIGLRGGLNTYQYCPNPVEWVDPLGLNCKDCPDKKESDIKSGVFPKTADEMSSLIGPPKKVGTTPDGTVRTTWTPNSSTKIRHESHPHGLKPGDAGYNPRHHGEHFHVETKPHNMSWSQARKQGQVLKSKPEGYTPGSGTGFLSGENFPGY